jgi:hypothetical protein
VEVCRQDDQGNWSTEVLGKDDKLHLDSVNLTLTMADIYECDRTNKYQKLKNIKNIDQNWIFD